MRTNKKVIRLTESDLRQMISESVKKILKENNETQFNINPNALRALQSVQSIKIFGETLIYGNDFEITIENGVPMVWIYDCNLDEEFGTEPGYHASCICKEVEDGASPYNIWVEWIEAFDEE